MASSWDPNYTEKTIEFVEEIKQVLKATEYQTLVEDADNFITNLPRWVNEDPNRDKIRTYIANFQSTIDQINDELNVERGGNNTDKKPSKWDEWMNLHGCDRLRDLQKFIEDTRGSAQAYSPPAQDFANDDTPQPPHKWRTIHKK